MEAKERITNELIEEAVFQMKEDAHPHKNDPLHIKQNDWKNIHICVCEMLHYLREKFKILTNLSPKAVTLIST